MDHQSTNRSARLAPPGANIFAEYLSWQIEILHGLTIESKANHVSEPIKRLLTFRGGLQTFMAYSPTSIRRTPVEKKRRRSEPLSEAERELALRYAKERWPEEFVTIGDETNQKGEIVFKRVRTRITERAIPKGWGPKEAKRKKDVPRT